MRSGTKRTEALIAALGAAPRKQFLGPTGAIAAGAAASAAMAILLSFAWLGPRDDLWPALVTGDFALLFKLVFTAAVAAAALPLVRDLSVPGKSPRLRPVLVAIFVAAVSAGGVGSMSVGEWSHHADYASWIECLWKIPALAIPAMILLGIGVRYLAPTRLTLAGAVVGMAAGGIGAIGYAFHCHDDSIALVMASYVLAISETTLIGALAGPVVLRWK